MAVSNRAPNLLASRPMMHEPSRPPHRGALRERLWEIVFEAETPAGKAFDVMLLCAIGLSVVAVMLESVGPVAAQWGPQFKVLEWFFTILFMAEYFLRIYLVRRPRHYIFSFFGIVDLLSWIPTFLAMFIVGSQSLLVIRILRLLRMFRILKMIHHVRGATVIMHSLAASRAKITVFFFAVVLFAVIVGTVAYIIEAPHNDSYANIPVSVYWAIVTMTTLGYGDIAPITVAGKFLASFAVLTGYAIIAVPTGIVTAEMFRAARPDETTDACHSCGCHGHLPDARYCRRCGDRLDLTPPEEAPAPPGREDGGES